MKLYAPRILQKQNVSIDVFELVRLDKLDLEPILKSIKRTGKLLIIDIGHSFAGAAAAVLSELISQGASFGHAPQILGLSNHPTPTAPSLAKDFYPRCIDILKAIKEILSLSTNFSDPDVNRHLDVPGDRFIGYY